MSTAPRTIGRCELFGRIARGGMASVHLARLKGAGQFSKTVAIKRMDERIAQNQDFVQMFLDEASLVARVRHPNVVSTLDLIQEGEELLIVMEYVEGVTLKDLVRAADAEGERIPVNIAVSLVAGALRGLHAAHEATGDRGEPLGVVHRDVSPDNIIVGRDGYPRVIDFGVAKALDRMSTTNEGELKGKIAYMAPEQIAGEIVTRRADVFMASIVLWELLTGRRLFKGKAAPEVIFKLMNDDAPLASSLVPHLPGGLDRVVARGLSRTPTERWPTALAMADTLESICPRVSPTEISAWVSRLAAKRLAELRALVREVETAPRTTEAQETTQVVLTSDSPEPRRSRNIVIGGGMTVVGLLVGAALFLGLRATSPPPPSPASTTVESPPPAPAPAPTVSAVPEPKPSEQPSAKVAEAPPAASSAKPVIAPRRPYPVRPKSSPQPKLYGID